MLICCGAGSAWAAVITSARGQGFQIGREAGWRLASDIHSRESCQPYRQGGWLQRGSGKAWGSPTVSTSLGGGDSCSARAGAGSRAVPPGERACRGGRGILHVTPRSFPQVSLGCYVKHNTGSQQQGPLTSACTCFPRLLFGAHAPVLARRSAHALPLVCSCYGHTPVFREVGGGWYKRFAAHHLPEKCLEPPELAGSTH
ncbi:hypothetical protein NDU88_005748 [Pleurodeles waltl]|uniref:Secreted protein n=1 Tax=Pleurodeles waltl TaxID=8319 RepID=A0AAV7SMP2_PLEWA|nr:hypothetical protein NDU88_005748 [Pleurodeles waltl]